jgi:hypothetical protein
MQWPIDCRGPTVIRRKGHWRILSTRVIVVAMSDPPAIGERFTVGLDPDGRPVQQRLFEMTAAEVLAAVEWQTAEANWLTREAEPAAAIIKAAEALRSPSPDEAALQTAIVQQADEARRRQANLRAMIHATIPQWPGTGAALGGAVRRFWPR